LILEDMEREREVNVSLHLSLRPRLFFVRSDREGEGHSISLSISSSSPISLFISPVSPLGDEPSFLSNLGGVDREEVDGEVVCLDLEGEIERKDAKLKGLSATGGSVLLGESDRERDLLDREREERESLCFLETDREGESILETE
jgi:hypothetical protein